MIPASENRQLSNIVLLGNNPFYFSVCLFHILLLLNPKKAQTDASMRESNRSGLVSRLERYNRNILRIFY